MITISAVSNPRATAHDDLVNVDLTTEQYGVIPCSLNPKDTTPYLVEGVETTNGELFRRVNAGEFGPVAAA